MEEENPNHEHDDELMGEHAKTPSKKQKKGRGPSKGPQTKTPMFLEFDEFNMPTGKWEEDYGTHIGFLASKLDINIREWKAVSKVDKDNMWDETKVLSNFSFNLLLIPSNMVESQSCFFDFAEKVSHT